MPTRTHINTHTHAHTHTHKHTHMHTYAHLRTHALIIHTSTHADVRLRTHTDPSVRPCTYTQVAITAAEFLCFKRRIRRGPCAVGRNSAPLFCVCHRSPGLGRTHRGLEEHLLLRCVLARMRVYVHVCLLCVCLCVCVCVCVHVKICVGGPGRAHRGLGQEHLLLRCVCLCGRRRVCTGVDVHVCLLCVFVRVCVYVHVWVSSVYHFARISGRGWLFARVSVVVCACECCRLRV